MIAEVLLKLVLNRRARNAEKVANRIDYRRSDLAISTGCSTQAASYSLGRSVEYGR